MSAKKRETLNAGEISAMPKGTIPCCPSCEGDTLTVSMSNARPTKVWCSEGCFTQHLEHDKDDKKADKKK